MHSSIYGFSVRTSSGEVFSLERYSGNVLLIVNTASRCGFTPQYAGLEKLYRMFHGLGFQVLAFPCNQFGAQEPGSEAEIFQFCELNFGVSFPVFSKVEVNGPNADPLFKFLRREQGGILGPIGLNSLRWNFTKFLVDRKGRVVRRFAPLTQPSRIAGQIETLLQG